MHVTFLFYLFNCCYSFLGNGLLSKFGKKTSTFDDNRRATYVISNQPVARSESIFTTFEAEIRQLVTVRNMQTE